MTLKLQTLSDENGHTVSRMIVADTQNSWEELKRLVIAGLNSTVGFTQGQYDLGKALMGAPQGQHSRRPQYRASDEFEPIKADVRAAHATAPTAYSPTQEDRDLCASDRTCGDYLYRPLKDGEA